MKQLTKQEIEDLIVGAKIMGTGGGGEEEWVRPLINEVYQKNKKFVLVDVDEVPQSKLVAITGRIGGGVSEQEAAKVKGLPQKVDRPEALAFSMLEKFVGQELYAVLPTELGAGNTLAAMCVAALLDKPTVNADCAGRAKPLISISTTTITKVPLTPACLVTKFGDVIYLRESLNDQRAEDILRSIAAASGGQAGLSRCPMTGSVLRNCAIKGSVSKCIEVGRVVREKQNPTEGILEITGGFKLFEGEVSSFTREEHGAFMWGSWSLKGTSEYKGHTLRVWFKNENLVSWLDEKPYVSCPDLICAVDATTGKGLSNWGNDFFTGRKVTVFGVPAHPLFRTEKGLELFTPSSFGFDMPYRPIEEIVKQ